MDTKSFQEALEKLTINDPDFNYLEFRQQNYGKLDVEFQEFELFCNLIEKNTTLDSIIDYQPIELNNPEDTERGSVMLTHALLKNAYVTNLSIRSIA